MTVDLIRRAPGVAPMTPYEMYRNMVLIENRLDIVELGGGGGGGGVTALSYNSTTKVLTFTNALGVVSTISLAGLAVDMNVTGASMSAGILTLTGDDGMPSVTVDLNSFATDAEVAALMAAEVSTRAAADSALNVRVTALEAFPGSPIANNLTTNDSTQVLAASQGVAINTRLSNLEAGVDGGSSASVF